jgi:DNA polymerase-1
LAREQGFVSTPLGRRRYIADINNSNRNIRLFAERAAVNMPIQGMAADIMKIAMIRVANALADPSTCHIAGVSGISFPKPLCTKMVLQVHDELLFEVPEDELERVAKIVRFCMEDAYHLKVPVKVDVKVGHNWAEMRVVGEAAD